MSNAEIVKHPGSNGSLQAMADTNWTRERIDLVKRAICP